MRNYEYERMKIQARQQGLDGFSLKKLVKKVKNASQKINRQLLDPRVHLEQVKGSLTNPKKQLKSDAQKFIDVHADPVNELTLQLGPERSAALALIASYIPVVGTVAAAAIAASSMYNQYKAQKTAAQLEKDLKSAYDNFDKNFGKLSEKDKIRTAKLLESSQDNAAAIDGIVLALADYTKGSKSRLQQMMAKIPASMVPSSVKTTAKAPAAAIKPASDDKAEALKKWLPVAMTVAGFLLFKG